MLRCAPTSWCFSQQGVGKGKEAVGNHLLPLPLLAFITQKLRAAESILRSKEYTAGWPLSKAQLLGLLWEYPPGTGPSVSETPGGGLIFRPLGFWVIDFVNASCDLSANLLGLFPATSTVRPTHAGQSAAPWTEPPAAPWGLAMRTAAGISPQTKPGPKVSRYKSRKTKDTEYNLQVFRIEWFDEFLINVKTLS